MQAVNIYYIQNLEVHVWLSHRDMIFGIKECGQPFVLKGMETHHMFRERGQPMGHGDKFEISYNRLAGYAFVCVGSARVCLTNAIFVLKPVTLAGMMY